jgi:hypothetical protein
MTNNTIIKRGKHVLNLKTGYTGITFGASSCRIASFTPGHPDFGKPTSYTVFVRALCKTEGWSPEYTIEIGKDASPEQIKAIRTLMYRPELDEDEDADFDDKCL